MNAPAAALVPIFATPFAAVQLAGSSVFNGALATLCAGRTTEEHRDASAPPDPLCFRSRENLLDWEHEAVTEFRQEMLAGLCAAVMAANLYSEAEFDALGVQVRARFVLVRPDGCVPAANVPMASWCAVYCVAAPPPAPARGDSGALRLYALRQGTMFMDAANWRLRPPFGGAHHMWRPVPGQMAVFPAWVLHEIALNRSDADLLLITARARFAHPDLVHGGQQSMPPW
ncbi:MAG TPA: hypothetical protein VEC59_11050 [Steroidobacteraceae bacterium]|nr:hypothetical protein [Steroidobacteraceae bacterium]